MHRSPHKANMDYLHQRCMDCREFWSFGETCRGNELIILDILVGKKKEPERDVCWGGWKMMRLFDLIFSDIGVIPWFSGTRASKILYVYILNDIPNDIPFVSAQDGWFLIPMSVIFLTPLWPCVSSLRTRWQAVLWRRWQRWIRRCNDLEGDWKIAMITAAACAFPHVSGFNASIFWGFPKWGYPQMDGL